MKFIPAYNSHFEIKNADGLARDGISWNESPATSVAIQIYITYEFVIPLIVLADHRSATGKSAIGYT